MEEPPTSPVMLVPEPDPIQISSPPQDAIDVTQTYDDGWVPQHSHDDSMQVSLKAVEINQQHQDPQTENARSREAISTEVPVVAMPGIRHLEKTPVLFTRPASSHVDLASGFSFSKARPAQSLNIGIKSQQVIHAGVSEKEQALAARMSPRQVLSITPPAPVIEGRSVRTNEDDQANLVVAVRASGDPTAVPFPVIHRLAGQEDTWPAVQSNARNSPLTDLAMRSTTPLEPSKKRELDSGDDTLVELDFAGRNAQHGTEKQMDARQVYPQVQTSSDQIRNAKFHKKKRCAKGSKSDARNPSWIQGEDDALQMFLFHRKKQRVEREDLLAIQAMQREKIAEFQDVNERLTTELQEVHKRLEEKEYVTRKLLALKPKLEARARKFGDFLNGLSEDHSQLRDNGRHIHEAIQALNSEQKANQENLQATRAALDMTQDAVKRERALWMRELVGDDQQMKILHHEVDELQGQLHREQAILDEQRARNDTLEQRISRASVDHERLMGAFSDQHEEMSKNIAQLLARSIQPPSSHSISNNMESRLEQYLVLFEQLRAKETLQSTELNRLEVSLKKETNAIMGSINSCADSIIKEMTVPQQISDFRQEFRELTGAITMNQTRHEQLTDLREVKATIQERLQGTEASLRDARLECGLLRSREQENLRRIAVLEAQVSHVQRELVKTPETYLRLRDLETRNRELIQQRTELQSEVSALSEHLLEKDNHVAAMNDQLASLQLTFEEAQAKNVSLEADKIANQQQVAIQSDQCRKELSEAAKVEIVAVRSELANAKRQLEQQQTSVSTIRSHITEQIDQMVLEKSRMERMLAERETLLQNAREELQREHERTLLLQENANKDKEKKNVNATKDVMRDEEITRLKAALERMQSSIPTLYERSRTISHGFEQPPVIEEDSQDVEYEIPRDMADIMRRDREAWSPKPIPARRDEVAPKSPSPDWNLQALFPSTPGGSSDMLESPLRKMSSQGIITYERIVKTSQGHQVKDSYSKTGKGNVSFNHDLIRHKSPEIVSSTTSTAPAPGGDTPLETITARNTAANSLGVRPNIKASRKRTASVADLTGPDEPRAPSRATRSSSRINGSIVADSHPLRLAPLQTARSQKMGTTNKRASRSGMYKDMFDRYQ